MPSHVDDEAPEARLLLPVVPAFYELHKGQFEVEAGFFTKRLHVRNDVQTAINSPAAQNRVMIALAPLRTAVQRLFRRLRRTHLRALAGLSRRHRQGR